MTSPFGLREEPFDIENPLRAPFASADHKEAFNSFFLALMARRRVMALFGETGMGKTTLLRSLIRHIEADGAVVLAVTARPAMTVEDLILAARPDLGPDPGADPAAPGDLEAVVNDIEQRIEEAGTGLFIVDDAHLLDVTALADLIELASSDTDTGRFLQVMVAGDHLLERKLAEPEFETAFRLHGVVHHLPPLEREAVEAFIRDRLRLAGAPQPDVFLPGAIDAATRLSAGLPSVLGALCGQALRIAAQAGRHRVDATHVQEAATALGMEAVPDIEIDIPDPVSYTEVREPIPAAAVPGRADARTEPAPPMPAEPPPPHHPPGHESRREPETRGDSGDRHVDDGGHREGRLDPWPDLAAPRREGEPGGRHRSATRSHWAVAAVAAGVLVAGTGLALGLGNGGALRSLYRVVAGSAEPDPVRNETTVAALPPPVTAAPDEVTGSEGPDAPAPPTAAPRPPADTTASIPAIPAPPAPVAVLPPDPATSPAQPAAPASAPKPEPEPEPEPSEPDPAPETRREVANLLALAERQIADKLLTTPAGDNAFETYERIVALDPGNPEAATILERIEDTYLSWARTAEEQGEYDDARRFYERALSVDPDDDTVAQRLQALDRDVSENAATSRTAAAGEGDEQAAPQPGPDQVLRLPPDYVDPADGGAQAPSPPVDEPNGFTSREEILAAITNPESLRSVIAAGHNLDHELPDGKTALMLAAERGRGGAVRMLLEAGAAPNARSRNGGTALMYAAGIGDDETIRTLIRHGGAVNAMNVDGKTALMAAAQGRHTDTVRLLLDSGADMNARSVQGRTALDYAEEAGDHASATLLRLRGARSGEASPTAAQRGNGGPRPTGPINLRAFKG